MFASAHRESVDKSPSKGTAGFPSDRKPASRSTQHQQHSGKAEPVEGDETEPVRPSYFEIQGMDDDKDSEDAESFDDDKQKSQVLDELDMLGEDDDDDIEPTKPRQQKERRKHKKRQPSPMEVFEEGEEDRVSERSCENEDEIRNREIEKKTMANVTNYDDWLEA